MLENPILELKWPHRKGHRESINKCNVISGLNMLAVQCHHYASLLPSSTKILISNIVMNSG